MEKVEILEGSIAWIAVEMIAYLMIPEIICSIKFLVTGVELAVVAGII